MSSQKTLLVAERPSVASSMSDNELIHSPDLHYGRSCYHLSPLLVANKPQSILSEIARDEANKQVSSIDDSVTDLEISPSCPTANEPNPYINHSRPFLFINTSITTPSLSLDVGELEHLTAQDGLKMIPASQINESKKR